VFKTVDTCGGEFPALTPYHYSSYDLDSEVIASDRKKDRHSGVRSKPNWAGIEFDYSCVHAAFALADEGLKPS
jgi:carbamoyl-phosphate synthase large subunit